MNWRPRQGQTERARAERELDAELAFHRRATIDELLAAGLTPEAAEQEARRRFGPLHPYRQRIVDVDLALPRAPIGRDLMTMLSNSLRATLRGIRHAPGFTIAVIGILTIGLGINALTLGLVDRLVLSGPAGIRNADEVRRTAVVRTTPVDSQTSTQLGYLDYRTLLDMDQLAGAAAESASQMVVGQGDQAERISTVMVSANYFSMLGVQPQAGRFFTTDESEREGARLAVLGYGYWQRRFGGGADAIGQTIAIGSQRYTVVGVTPPEFTGSSVTRADLFLPLESAASLRISGDWRTTHDISWLGIIVRLGPDTNADAAAAEATVRLGAANADLIPTEDSIHVEFPALNPVRGGTASGDAGIAALVGGVSLLVLLIAFANVANLFLARSLRRRDQVALRLALGGARWQLILEEAAEGAWLALLGATVAVAAASFGAPALQQFLFPKVAWVDSAVDLRVLTGLGLLAIIGGSLAAALPMWQAGRADVSGWLRTNSNRGTRNRTRTQAAMLVVQGALSVLLLVGASLFVRSMAAAETLDLGLDTDRLLVVSSVRGDEQLPTGFDEQLATRAASVPGVAASTRVAGTLPFVSGWGEDLRVPGLPERPRVDDGGPYLEAVGPHYFDVVGTEIVKGRGFTDQDRLGTEFVAVVNETMARLYWPGEEALGKCLQIGEGTPPCSTIVGIAENTHRQALVEGDTLLYYIPFDQAPDEMKSRSRVVIRTVDDDGLASGVSEALRREALAIAPGLRFVDVRRFDDIISPQLRTWRLGAGLFGSFGVLALVVATVGLYSVIAFDVEGRRREMSVRSALGATASSLVGLVVRDALQASLGGLALGLFLAWLLTPTVSHLLYAAPAQDIGSFVTAAGLLVGAALVASAIPGLRAARVNPSIALRNE